MDQEVVQLWDDFEILLQARGAYHRASISAIQEGEEGQASTQRVYAKMEAKTR